ncbi:conjugative transposon protein TraN [Alistipes shahii]|uniref:conjugative transposon protein TraN n=1 Tax=Alistipes shahii TaxID=328814 RepID=UPI001105AA2A|nr:conjugative transposon protein TraN [Alistipes shahii]
MKRDLIYLPLIVAAITAAKVTAQTTPETPAEIRPQHIEAGFTKTVHILFPSPVTYIDIGSMDIIAGKADGAENVVRVKAAVRNFAAETNLTVITEDGGFFTFDVYYAENPAVSTLNLTVQEPQPESMKKPAAVGDPLPTAPASEGRVLLREVGREKPATIKRMLSDIYRQNRTDVKGIRTKKYGIEVEVLGIYVFNDVIYMHTCISNDTNISFEVDARRFIVADRKLAKRTAQQQTPLEILRVCNDPAVVRGHQRQRTVFALPKLTISDDKVLLLEIIEKNGARHQTVEIPAEELLEAKLREK